MAFGRKKDDDGRAGGLDSQLDAELERIGALSLPQFAAEVMTRGFSSDYDPSDPGRQIEELADEFSPRPQRRLKDTTVRAQLRAAREASDSTTAQGKLLRLQELVAEGVQALEQASLVHSKDSWDGVANHVGYTTTRLGRDALERNAVDRILGGGTL